MTHYLWDGLLGGLPLSGCDVITREGKVLQMGKAGKADPADERFDVSALIEDEIESFARGVDIGEITGMGLQEGWGESRDY